MELYSFILGVSSVVGIIIMILSVVGYVKVIKIGKNLDSFQQNFSVELDNRIKDIHDNTCRINDKVNRRIDNLEREVFSQMDSRLDKLESRFIIKNKNLENNFEIVHRRIDEIVNEFEQKINNSRKDNLQS